MLALYHRCTQGCNEGARGPQFPGRRITMGAPNHCGVRRKVPAMSQVLSSIQHICFLKISNSNMGGAKLASCPGHHLTSLLPWVYSFLHHKRLFQEIALYAKEIRFCTVMNHRCSILLICQQYFQPFHHHNLWLYCDRRQFPGKQADRVYHRHAGGGRQAYLGSSWRRTGEGARAVRGWSGL